MAEEPICTAKSPIKIELEPGTYWWCSCGRTSHTPFCDGSHKGTGLQPKKIEISEKTTMSLCQCKATDNAPLCDGSHRGL
ncbi:MAG: CDGSH iron-sulfur domain-containing protein [Akkermansiaceae bacterium]|jgi:CDGSH iron-sulfur domain-containing protein 3|nr:CDGSH iron-sulfur domain-containing protein [Akkermansiaceae bacterium]MDP4647920.1 CDGSH iron-sulfur domain-containing protein [Akkermansiaceae bacterium]MDP4719709.1 CDGSH iron-sulfur domain-containing protein [Akkermansiaceae bacterium]MDP4781264.1 CDGSH iron-sulfur domain-containing protein [Akkermansiaceae bacterium]MDP4846020.1 CDGSH iron-sulfur domain-containing protein [Akkermansiaceae bacterium]